MIISRTILFLFFSVILVSAVAQDKKVGKLSKSSLTLFSVNKKPVSVDEFVYLYRKNHQNKEEDFTTVKIQEYLDLYVNFKLKVEEARRRGMDTTTAFVREFNQYRDELKKPYLPGNGLTDSLVRLTYDRMKEEVRASHIMIELKPDASPQDTAKAFNRIMEIRSRVIGGEDFSRVASELSEDPSAKSNNGDLGYFTALQMVYPFENAAYTTKVGDVSKPVRTRFGYHILKVMDRRPSRGEVEIAHLLLRTGDRPTEEVKDKIFSIYDQLQAGVSWDDLCKEHSEDPSTKDSGGKLRPFGAGMMSSLPEFERVAFELEKPGQISDPFETQYGWHIMRLIRKIPLASFEELAPSLKTKISRDERTQVSKDALQVKLLHDLGFRENAEVKAKVFALADSTLQQGKWNRLTDKATLDAELMAFGGKKIAAREFVAYVSKNQRPTNLAPARYMQQLYADFVDQRMFDVLEADIVAKNPEYKFLMNEYYEGILLFEIMEKEVWNKASEDSLGQVKFFKDNAQKYRAGERIHATIYSSTSTTGLDDLRKLIAAGDEPKVAELVTNNKIRSETGYFKKEDKPILNAIPWSEGVHPTQHNNMNFLVRIRDVLPEGLMSFAEARPQVISDYQNHLEANWVSQLKKKFSVKVDKAGKAAAFRELQSK